MDAANLCQILDRFPLLEGIHLDASQLITSHYHAGQMVSDHPRGISSIGFILSGFVEVYSVALDGTDVLLNQLQAADCFGICNLFNEEDLQTVLRAASELDILFIPKPILKQALAADGQLALRFASFYQKRVQFLLKRIELLTMQSCRARVAAYFLNSFEGERGFVFSGSREDLARHLGISRAALYRELALLVQAKLVKVDGKRFLVLDRHGLEDYLYHSPGK